MFLKIWGWKDAADSGDSAFVAHAAGFLLCSLWLAEQSKGFASKDWLLLCVVCLCSSCWCCLARHNGVLDKTLLFHVCTFNSQHSAWYPGILHTCLEPWRSPNNQQHPILASNFLMFHNGSIFIFQCVLLCSIFLMFYNGSILIFQCVLLACIAF